MEIDTREPKLPLWAQEQLHQLRRKLNSSQSELNLTVEENQRLRNLIDGIHGETDSDTNLINDDTAAKIPLGNGSTVEFGGIYTVHWSAGTVELLVESMEDLSVHPEYANLIAITERRKNA
jgi:hypothetical protein